MRAAALALLLAAAVAAEEAADVERAFLDREREAFAHYNRRDWTRAVAAFESQIAVYAGNPRPYYNIACCYALQGDAERAGTWLTLAVLHGWRDREHLAQDPDFAAVRDSRAYADCLARLDSALAADPDPLPRDLDPSQFPAMPSADVVARAFLAQEAALERVGGLLEESQL
ncbi:MAG: TPR end-of-group domain-containing protein, partial [Planctomycetota bacterium]